LDQRLFVRGVAVWFVLMGAEFVHGIARAIWLVPVVGDFRCRQIGVFTGSILNLTIAALFIRWSHPARRTDALAIGFVLFVLTLIFEITFGRAVMQASWQRIGLRSHPWWLAPHRASPTGTGSVDHGEDAARIASGPVTPVP
jgi:hypothetical protein